MEYSLRGSDLMKMLNNSVSIITYSKLAKLDKLDQLFNKHGCVIILFETKRNSGHWTLLIDVPQRVDFFDPYGVKPDDELDFIDKDFRINSNQDYPKLLELLYNCGKPVHYNQYQFQEMRPMVNTCGRWCVVRAMHYFMTCDQFKKFVDINSKNAGMTYDEWIVDVTS